MKSDGNANALKFYAHRIFQKGVIRAKNVNSYSQKHAVNCSLSKADLLLWYSIL